MHHYSGLRLEREPRGKGPCRARKKVAAGLLCAAVAISAACIHASATPAEDYQKNVHDRTQLQQQIDANQAIINNIMVEKTALQEEYDSIKARVDAAQAELDALDAQIEDLEAELDAANQELDDRFQVYCNRIREIEEYGTTTYWSILFAATDLQDLLNRLDYVEEIMAHDSEAMEKVQKEVNALDARQSKLVELRSDRNYASRSLRDLQNKLYTKIQARLDEISSYEAQNAEYAAEVQRLTVEGLELLNRMNRKDYVGTSDPAEIYQKYVVETGQAERTPLGAQIVAFTLQFNGGEYVWGGASPEEGFDCSGMMYYVYGQFGYRIMRTASMQYKYNGVNVDFASLQSGDMVFFHPDGGTNVSHVGMYIGDGLFIHAASRSSGIKINSLYSSYYTTHYLGARRII